MKDKGQLYKTTWKLIKTIKESRLHRIFFHRIITMLCYQTVEWKQKRNKSEEPMGAMFSFVFDKQLLARVNTLQLCSKLSRSITNVPYWNTCVTSRIEHFSGINGVLNWNILIRKQAKGVHSPVPPSVTELCLEREMKHIPRTSWWLFRQFKW